MNDILIGTIIGGAISIATDYFNNRASKTRQILDEKLSVYKKIAQVIIEEKLKFESTVGEIALLKQNLSAKKISEDEAHKNFQLKIDCLSETHNKVYSLFVYSYFLEKKIIDKINNLYTLLAQAMNPNIMLQKEKLQKIEVAFESILESLATSLGIKNQIKIINPNKLCNEAFDT